MSFRDSVTSLLQSLSSLFALPYVDVGAGVLVLVGIVIALSLSGWGAVLVASPWFWGIFILLLAGAIFAGLRWGIPRLRERRFVRTGDPTYVVAGQESPEEFLAKFLNALQTLRSLPQLAGRGDPLYALPWYLLIGESGSGKTAALQEAGLFSPLTPLPSDGGATQNSDWWVSNSVVVLDTAGRYATPVDMARDRAEWYRLLRLLRQHRGQKPIDGLVITVAADKLIAQPSEEQLRAEASKLRERIQEAVRELGVDFPVYLVVTKCDLLEGFAEFFWQLPERVTGEVIGFVDAPPVLSQNGPQPARGAEALRRLRAGLQSIYDRLHLFRLSILEGKAPETLRPAIFNFPEEFKALQLVLSSFAETLFNEDVRYHTPLFRGIFFTSARQQGAPSSLLRRQLHLTEETILQDHQSRSYFLRDLFLSMLPRDRALAQATERAQKRKWLTRTSGLFAVTALLLFLAVLLFRGFILDRHIAGTVNPATCPETVRQAPAMPALDETEGCRQTIQKLIDQNGQRPRWSTLVFRRSLRLEKELRQRYVQNFKVAVLEPLNRALERAFNGSTDPLPLMLVLAQRIQLSQRCVSSGGCVEVTTDDLQPDYALLLNPQHDQQPQLQAVAKLRRISLAYLFWQRAPYEDLQQDLAADQKRLQRWLSAKRFNPDQLLVWVNKRSPPLTYETYWELPAPITAVAPAQVEAACTEKVWERDLAPFLQQLQDAIPEAGQTLLTFRQQYLSTCFAQWQRFLAGFPQGAERWKGLEKRQTLMLRLLSENSPYRRVIEETATNLTPWLPAQGGTATAPAWVTALTTFSTSPERQAYQDVLKKIGAQLEGHALPEACFKLAQTAFAEGKPTEEATNPVLRAWWLATQARQKGAPAQQSEDIWGPLLSEPVRYVWRTILDEASLYVQKNWAEQVSTPLKGLPPAEQVTLLYGPAGKVSSFVEQFVRPFLAGEEPRAGTVLGEAMPFSPRFVQLLGDVQQIKTVFDGGAGPQPVQIRAARHPDIEGRSSLVQEQTVFSITCAGKTYRVTGEAPMTVPWSYQSCGEASLSIYLSAGAKRFAFTKRYSGQTGFLYFLQDFLTGSHRFAAGDFESDPEGESLLRDSIRSIQMYYRLDVPPTLEKLLSALQGTTTPGDIISRPAF